MIPEDKVQEYVASALTKIRAGVADFAAAAGQVVTMGDAQITLEIVFGGEGDALIDTKVIDDDHVSSSKTTQTEKAPSNTASPIQVTENIKTGSYTQSGFTTQQQSGGSRELVDYKYDPTE